MLLAFSWLHGYRSFDDSAVSVDCYYCESREAYVRGNDHEYSVLSGTRLPNSYWRSPTPGYMAPALPR